MVFLGKSAVLNFLQKGLTFKPGCAIIDNGRRAKDERD